MHSAAEQEDDNITIADADEPALAGKPDAELLRARSTSEYDDRGRRFRGHVFSVDPTDGTVSEDSLTSASWFGTRGQAVKTSEPGGLVIKNQTDGAGRTTITYVTDGGGDEDWANAMDVTGDIVLTQCENVVSVRPTPFLTSMV